MRKILCLVVAISPLFSIAQVGIGTNSPHPSAQLEVKSSGKGLLPPRVALQGTDDASKTTPTIPNPIAGLLVYNTTAAGSGATAVTAGFYYYNGAAWVKLVVPTDNASNVTGTVAVANGGTGATDASTARTNLGLGNVNNTSDANKPISSATQTALDSKAPINNPTFTGTVGGITKTMVGLENVDNTSDANKPISSATQTALDSKAPINNPTFTGTVGGITKTMVGLENVDNTSDANKPISTATQTALNLKENASNKSNSTSLGTSDVLYPTQNAVKAYVDAQTTSDASSTVKGKVQLAGDLTGTAALPVIANGAINSAKLADGAVTTTKITNANITTDKIADAAITDAKIATVSGSKVTGTVAIANGGTASTTAAEARTNLGATTVGSNLFTLSNPSAITFPRFNADNTVTALSAIDFRTAIGATTVGSNLFTLPNQTAIRFPRINADNTVSTLTDAEFRTAIGAGTSSTTGTVTSVSTGNGITGGTITNSGTIGLTGQALALHNLSSNGLVARTAEGTVSARTITGTTNQITVSNGDGVAGNPTLSLPQNIHTAATPTFASATFNGTVGMRAPAASSTPTQILVVTNDPSTTTRNIETRTPAQLRSDIGAQASLTNPVTGTGTTGYLAEFSGTSSLVNSAIFENSGKIGIGTTSPGTSLHIQNSNSMSGDPSNNSVPSIFVYNSNSTSPSAHSILALQTGGVNGGKPYISLDAKGFQGYSIGMNNPTNQLIINTTWDFQVGTPANNAVIINETGKSRVIISNSSGFYREDWPSNWDGGLATNDIVCSSILYSGTQTRSDKRLKNTINTIEDNMINNYLKLRPVSFYWNKDQGNESKLQYGFIAQEIEEIFPEIVSKATDSMQTRSVNYQALHALSLKVIQSQHTEIENLKRNQKDLEERLRKLEERLK